jgi:hypothetical protein
MLPVKAPQMKYYKNVIQSREKNLFWIPDPDPQHCAIGTD